MMLPSLLTELDIELLNASDLLTAFSLLEEHDISTDDVETIEQAQSKLWARLAEQQNQDQTEIFYQATEHFFNYRDYHVYY